MSFHSINLKSKSDPELIVAYQKTQNTLALGILYNRYIHLVYGLCLNYFKERELAKDATMDIYLSLTEKLLTHEVTHFKSWLYIVSKNHCLMRLRKTSPEIRTHTFMEMEASMHPNTEIQLDDDLDALEVCMEKLKEEQETCIRLFYLEHKSYQEISIQRALALNEVKSHIQNAKRNLKICIESTHVQEANQ